MPECLGEHAPFHTHTREEHGKADSSKSKTAREDHEIRESDEHHNSDATVIVIEAGNGVGGPNLCRNVERGIILSEGEV